MDLTQRNFTPDAAGRFPGSNVPLGFLFVGDPSWNQRQLARLPILERQRQYTHRQLMTLAVNKKPSIHHAKPAHALLSVSSVIPGKRKPVTFTSLAMTTRRASLVVSATSTNQNVVPDANLTLTNYAPGQWRLSLEPIGAGYSESAIHGERRHLLATWIPRLRGLRTGSARAKLHSGVSVPPPPFPSIANWMIIGDDENQVLRYYSRTRSGGPVAVKDMNPFLHITDYYPDGTPREVDIEGSTRVGNRIYWVGSHSHAFNATVRTNRAPVFATDILRAPARTRSLKLLSRITIISSSISSTGTPTAVTARARIITVSPRVRLKASIPRTVLAPASTSKASPWRPV
ncbi:MAG: hypothetical protein IPK15_25030 [Verrucomicrobia bacterium]|nr:hypothetical protein [Verrucomicrobiota bacterium]